MWLSPLLDFDTAVGSPTSPGTSDSPNTIPSFSTHQSGGGGGTTPPSGEFNLPGLSLRQQQQQWDSEGAQQMLAERELTISDFDDFLELKFKPQGNQDPPVPTPPHKLSYSFKFKVQLMLSAEVFFCLY